ncbi:MAG: hypothetical protein RMX65_018730 [Nostoc sp. DedQUE01]
MLSTSLPLALHPAVVYLSRLLEAGIDVLTVCELAGHANPATTQKYDLRSQTAKREAVKFLNVLYENSF